MMLTIDKVKTLQRMSSGIISIKEQIEIASKEGKAILESDLLMQYENKMADLQNYIEDLSFEFS